jgi:hypothetical protein
MALVEVDAGLEPVAGLGEGGLDLTSTSARSVGWLALTAMR